MEKSSTFQGPKPNSRTFQDNWKKSRPFQDCTSHVNSCCCAVRLVSKTHRRFRSWKLINLKYLDQKNGSTEMVHLVG